VTEFFRSLGLNHKKLKIEQQFIRKSTEKQTDRQRNDNATGKLAKKRETKTESERDKKA